MENDRASGRRRPGRRTGDIVKRIAPAVALLAIAALSAWPRGAALDAATTPPTIELIETRPIETSVGNPDLRTAHEVWIELIKGARRSVDLEHFYLSDWPNEPMKEVLAEIWAAAGRGVAVRLLLDAGMRRTYPQPAESLARFPNIQVRWIAIRKITGGVQHAKMMLVDGRAVVIGSHNLDWRALKHIHELGVAVRDLRVAQPYQRMFELDWAAAGAQAEGKDSLAVRKLANRTPLSFPRPTRIALAAGDTVEVWPGWSPKTFAADSNAWDLDNIVRMVDAAKGEIVFQSLHLSPEDRGIRDARLIDALTRAAGRGVKVRAAISDWTVDGHGIKDLQEFSKTPNVEAKLSILPEWSGGYIPFARVDHTKYMVVDTLWTWVGTSNLEPGYFHTSRNYGMVLRNRNIAHQARRSFASVWQSPTAVRVRPDTTFTPRTHRETPPPGQKAYGK
jgi:phosphatidylserine/phosphatidylglycerophosphate/cardiolipin synthase-like enzyme